MHCPMMIDMRSVIEFVDEGVVVATAVDQQGSQNWQKKVRIDERCERPRVLLAFGVLSFTTELGRLEGRTESRFSNILS